jgi:hypothetical protein
MLRRLRHALVTLAAALVFTGAAQAAGGNYVFDGGTAKEQAQVRAALAASAFDWSVVPAQVTIHLARGTEPHATPGHVYLDTDALTAGRFAWATVQDEYAHQVDFFLFDGPTRERLNRALGGADWCYTVPGLDHSQYGCERFASTLVWAYWPSEDNAYKPTSRADESAAMAPAQFRALMQELTGVADTVPARKLAKAARRS